MASLVALRAVSLSLRELMSSFVSSLPFTESAMLPVSSETTITTASVSSVMPRAARWRVPRVLL